MRRVVTNPKVSYDVTVKYFRFRVSQICFRRCAVIRGRDRPGVGMSCLHINTGGDISSSHQKITRHVRTAATRCSLTAKSQLNSGRPRVTSPRLYPTLAHAEFMVENARWDRFSFSN
jgi:hypothetical protein